VIAAIVALQATAVGAVPSGDLVASGPVPNGDELVDLQRIAKATGRPLNEVVNDIGWQNEFAIKATQIEQTFPDDFAAAGVTEGAVRQAWIGFRGAPPEGARAILSELRGVSVEIRSEKGFSFHEVEAEAARLHTGISARRDVVPGAVTTFDVETGEILIEVDGQGAADRARLKDAASALVSAQQPSRRVVVRVADGLSVENQTAYGGGRLEIPGSGSLACTGGFTVRNTANVRGTSTAGHCPNSMTFENYNGATEYSMSTGVGHEGRWGDLQWHTVADTEVDDFYYDYSRARDVASVANPVQGQTVCHFGQTSGAACNQVQDLSACVTVDGVQACRLVRMSSDTGAGGDSGGPWYYGNTAYGIHKGSVGTVFGSRDVWSRVTYLDEAIGVSVLTS